MASIIKTRGAKKQGPRARVRFASVIGFSSEDEEHPASNLVKGDPDGWQVSTWKKRAWCVLKLEKRSQIWKLDIKNSGSAFIEVMVARLPSQDAPDLNSMPVMNSEDDIELKLNVNFEMLLSPSYFMKASEAQRMANMDRQKTFDEDKLDQTTVKEEWDLVKIVCAQPFNKSINYGVSSIKLHGPSNEGGDENEIYEEEVKDKEELEEQEAKEAEQEDDMPEDKFTKKDKDEDRNKQKEKPSFSIYSLRDDEDEDESNEPAGRYFSKSRAQMKKKSPSPPPQTTATSPPKKPRVNPLGPSIKNPELASKPAKMRYPKKRPFREILRGVVFALSGFVNPERAQIRSKALEMGAKYRPDWTSDCTHLVCAFEDTPKYNQVLGTGKIVTKDWISDCYNKALLLPWQDYKLGDYDFPSSSESETEGEEKSGYSSDIEDTAKDQGASEEGADEGSRLESLRIDKQENQEEKMDVIDNTKPD